MREPEATLALADYRNQVWRSYAAVRNSPRGVAAWLRWRAERDRLFSDHPQSAIDPADRPRFKALAYYAYDPRWRVTARVDPVAETELEIAHSGTGATTYRRFGRVRVELPGGGTTLYLFWLDTYGGGIFLPFRDATAGTETYGGGRYLLDTAKGADLGLSRHGELVLDFNYAYHPSCVYNARWSCPLAPRANHLPVAVTAGERLPDFG
jgi:uncharacterized protein (DUF1684 family)